MEKLNYFLKALIGVLLIISFVLTFSSCMKKQDENKQDTTSLVSGEMNDTAHTSGHRETQSSNRPSDGNRWNSIKDKVKQEEKELNSEMMELETKASSVSEKVKNQVKKVTDDIKSERDRIKTDSLKPEFKDEWDSFKTKTRGSLDSLRIKLKMK